MKKIKLYGLLSGVLLVGVASGGWLGAYCMPRVIYQYTGKPEVDYAFVAAQKSRWLAALRLNEPNDVILSLESSLNISLGAVAAWNEIAPPDEKTRKSRDSWLLTVKVYRENYPDTGEYAVSMNALLSTVPGRSPNDTCDSYVARLDDLRLAKLHSTTNSP